MSTNSSKQFEALSSFLKDNGLFPAGSKLSQTILLQLYRLLAKSQPVDVDFLAQSLGLETSAVNSTLKQIPSSHIIYNQTGAISAYRGLDLNKSRHRFTVNNKPLYTWCAFDCLFLPELLNCEAEIFSTCPGSGRAVHFQLDSNGKTIPAPTNLFVSFVMPDVRDYEDDLQQKFCCHVNFFTSKKAGVDWMNNRANCALIIIEEAIELAKIRNNTGFGKVLG